MRTVLLLAFLVILAFRRTGSGELTARATLWTARDDVRALFISSHMPSRRRP